MFQWKSKNKTIFERKKYNQSNHRYDEKKFEQWRVDGNKHKSQNKTNNQNAETTQSSEIEQQDK